MTNNLITFSNGYIFEATTVDGAVNGDIITMKGLFRTFPRMILSPWYFDNKMNMTLIYKPLNDVNKFVIYSSLGDGVAFNFDYIAFGH